MTTKAVVVKELGKTFEEAIPKVTFGTNPKTTTMEGEKSIRIVVKAASVNFFDLLMLVGKYQYKPKLPFVLLTEAAGIVAAVGAGVTRFRVGDRVLFSTGIEGAGAEQVVVEESGVQMLPRKLSFAQGAGFLMGYKTAYHGLVHRGELKKEEWCLVTGAGGGMGLAAVQLAKALGARVIACASDDAKLAACKRAGADHVVNYGGGNLKKLKDAVDVITGGDFVDVIYDVVGGDVFDQCVRCVATKGGARLLVVGFADGRIPTLPVNLALIKGFSLVGVRMGAQMIMEPAKNEEMEQTLLKMAEEGLLAPIVEKEFPAERCVEALNLVKDRKVVGKTVITFNNNIS